jgi:hypothetical protein
VLLLSSSLRIVLYISLHSTTAPSRIAGGACQVTRNALVLDLGSRLDLISGAERAQGRRGRLEVIPILHPSFFYYDNSLFPYIEIGLLLLTLCLFVDPVVKAGTIPSNY